MMKNCLLPPRHLLLICNDSSLSTYDDLHIPKIWDKTKQNKQLNELDKVELKLDKQFQDLVSIKVPVKSKNNEDEKDHKIDQNVDSDKKDNTLKETIENPINVEEKTHTAQLAKTGDNKAKEDSDLTHLDVDKCVLTEKNMNIDVIGSIFDPIIYKESLKEFSNFLINVNLFNKAKIKINECKQANRKFLKLNTNTNNNKQNTLFSNTNSITTIFLHKDSDEVCLRKRKGRKRKATEKEIIY